MERIAIYLMRCGAPLNCTYKVERDEQGDVILPDLGACAYTQESHRKALERAIGRINNMAMREEPKP